MDKTELVEKLARAVIELSDNIDDRDGLSNATEVAVDIARASLSHPTTEREKIVGWLREEAKKGLAIADAAPAGSKRERNHVAGVIAVRNAADAIEKGARHGG